MVTLISLLSPRSFSIAAVGSGATSNTISFDAGLPEISARRGFLPVFWSKPSTPASQNRPGAKTTQEVRSARVGALSAAFFAGLALGAGLPGAAGAAAGSARKAASRTSLDAHEMGGSGGSTGARSMGAGGGGGAGGGAFLHPE